MQKLKNVIVDRMMKLHLTKSEVDFILELAHYQDLKGRIYGVYYKKICKAIDISYETYYVILNSLAEKGLIEMERGEYGDYDVTILDNDFSYEGAMKEGYVDVGQHQMFYDTEFNSLKAGEKLLALQVLKIMGPNKRYSISVENFLEKYVRLLQVTKRTIRGYLARIKQFFTFTRKNKILYFRPDKADEDKRPDRPTDLDNLSQYLMDVACRRNRVDRSGKQVTETRLLVKQCHLHLKADMARIFLEAIKCSIEKLNASVSNKYKWIREFRPALIHKMICQKM